MEKQQDVASRQQTSYGPISECGRHGKGYENYCHYAFPVAGEVYEGISKAAPGIGIGQTVVVYYDGQNPKSNELEDFFDKGRKTKRYFDFSIFVLGAMFAYVLWTGPPLRKMPDEPNS